MGEAWISWEYCEVESRVILLSKAVMIWLIRRFKW